MLSKKDARQDQQQRVATTLPDAPCRGLTELAWAGSTRHTNWVGKWGPTAQATRGLRTGLGKWGPDPPKRPAAYEPGWEMRTAPAPARARVRRSGPSAPGEDLAGRVAATHRGRRPRAARSGGPLGAHPDRARRRPTVRHPPSAMNAASRWPKSGSGTPTTDTSHRGMGDEQAFDLGGIDVLAAADDHVVVPAVDEIEPVGTMPHVPGGDHPVDELLEPRRVALEDHLVAAEDPPRLSVGTSAPSASSSRTTVPRGGVPAVSGWRRRSDGVAMQIHEASVEP